MPGAIPTPTLTWDTTKVNQAIAASGSGSTNAINAWLAVMNSFVGFGTNPATCKGSSNGTGTGALDGVNRCTTALVTAGAGTNHSWIVLEFAQINDGAGHKLQVCFDFLGSMATSTPSTFLSAAAGFTGGSATARPTATDEQQLTNLGGIGVLNGNTTSRVHVVQSTNGKVWVVIICNGNQPAFDFVIAAPTPTIDAVPDQPAGWSYPWIAMWDGASSATNQVTASNLSTSSAKHLCRHSATAGQFGIQWEGGTGITSGAGNSPNSITSQTHMLGFGVWATTGIIGRLGLIPDMFICGDNVFSASVGSTIGADDTHRQWAVFGSLIVKWTNDATVPLGS